MSNLQTNPYLPVSPVDTEHIRPHPTHTMSDENTATLSGEKKEPTVTIRSRTGTSSSSSSSLSLRSPRTARFAEATSVNSPIGPTAAGRSPFADPITTTHYAPQPQPSDVGFGYMSENDPSNRDSHVEVPLTPKSPMKSALKVPGTPGRFINPLSPTFKEEQFLEKQEEATEKVQAKDLKVKTRVRMAKMVLRATNFSCSLIVLSMLSTTFSIFNATKHIPARSNLPAWAKGTSTWPQITLLVISCVSLFFSLVVFYAYWKGGHRRAEKAAVYYTMFAIGFFVFSTVMWILGAAFLHGSRVSGQGKDLWGWSCNDNKRRALFQQEVHYALVCRLQNWSLVCAIIEIVVEVITISIYGIVFYRFWSKRKLHKSMDVRDRARSDLYLAQLRTQSAPNTPGFAPGKTPLSPSFPAHLHDHNRSNNDDDEISAAEDGNATQYAQRHLSVQQPKPFTLQPPPIKVHGATPTLRQDGFEPALASGPVRRREEEVQEHVPAAPGEQTYESVPIPGAYASPLASPAFPAQGQGMSFGQAR